MLYKSSLHLCSSTPLPATSFEGLEVVLRVGKAGSVIRIVPVYRPPSTVRKSVPFQTVLVVFSIVLERCATHQTACVILGDFNVHYGDVTAMYRVTNEITVRKQPPMLLECSDSHEGLAARFRVYFSEKDYECIVVVPHHPCSQLATIITTFVLCHHSHPQLLVLSFDS